MPWTRKQERYMYANHPEIAKRVTHEPGYHTKQTLAAAHRRLKKKKPAK